jgi:hypothetical protein
MRPGCTTSVNLCAGAIVTNQTLTEEEYALMKEHARVGAVVVGAIPGSIMLQKAIEHHHEAFDGALSERVAREHSQGMDRRAGRRLREHDIERPLPQPKPPSKADRTRE